jgi:hypothetical protein
MTKWSRRCRSGQAGLLQAVQQLVPQAHRLANIFEAE